MKAHLLVAVWGKWHVEQFFELGLPCLMAEENIPALQKDHEEVRLVIYTRASDLDSFEKSPVFQRCREIVSTDLIGMPDSEFTKTNPIETHHRLWKEGLDQAAKKEAWVGFIPPDIVISNGFLKTTAELIRRGNWAVYVQQHRVTAETFIPELKERFPDPFKTEVAPRQLVDLLIRHVHPVQAAYFRSQRHFCPHIELLFYPVSPTEFYGTTVNTLPIAADSRRFLPNDKGHIVAANTEDHDQIGFITDSDDGVLIGTGPMGQYSEMFMNFTRMSPNGLARWLQAFYSSCYPTMLKQDYHYHTNEPGDSKAYHRARRAANVCKTLSQIHFNIQTLWKTSLELRCKHTADLISFAQQKWNLARAWPSREPATILIPDDKAFNLAGGNALLAPFLEPGARKRLFSLLMNHALLVPVDFDTETLQIRPAITDGVNAIQIDDKSWSFKTAGGQKVTAQVVGDSITLNGAKITSPPILREMFIIYKVDGVLFTKESQEIPLDGGYRCRSTCYQPPSVDNRLKNVSFTFRDLPERLTHLPEEDKKRQADLFFENAFQLRILSIIEDVLRHYSEVMNLPAENIAPLKQIESVASYKELNRAAEELLLWAITLVPQHGDALYQLGELRFHRGAFHEAHNLMQGAYHAGRKTKEGKDDAILRGNVGWYVAHALLKMNYPKEAYESLLISLSHLPFFPQGNYEMGSFVWEQNLIDPLDIITQFGNGMSYHVNWLHDLPKLPDNLPERAKDILEQTEDLIKGDHPTPSDLTRTRDKISQNSSTPLP